MLSSRALGRLVLAGVLAAAGTTVGAQPLVVVNTLPDRPVLSWATAQGTVTRTVAPGQRASFEALRVSGLGLKDVAVTGGQVYYLARFGAVPGLYRLAPGQVLVVNQAGRPVTLALGAVQSCLANGTPALGELSGGELTVTWDGGEARLRAGGVYRLVLASPGGVGTTVSLIPWE